MNNTLRCNILHDNAGQSLQAQLEHKVHTCNVKQNISECVKIDNSVNFFCMNCKKKIFKAILFMNCKKI